MKDIEVQYEAKKLLVVFGDWEDLLSATFELMLPYFVNPKPEGLERSSRFGHNGAAGESSQTDGKTTSSSLPQMCAIDLSQALFKVVANVNPRIFEEVLMNGTMFGLIGSFLNERIYCSTFCGRCP